MARSERQRPNHHAERLPVLASVVPAANGDGAVPLEGFAVATLPASIAGMCGVTTSHLGALEVGEGRSRSLRLRGAGDVGKPPLPGSSQYLLWMRKHARDMRRAEHPRLRVRGAQLDPNNLPAECFPSPPKEQGVRHVAPRRRPVVAGGDGIGLRASKLSSGQRARAQARVFASNGGGAFGISTARSRWPMHLPKSSAFTIGMKGAELSPTGVAAAIIEEEDDDGSAALAGLQEQTRRDAAEHGVPARFTLSGAAKWESFAGKRKSLPGSVASDSPGSPEGMSVSEGRGSKPKKIVYGADAAVSGRRQSISAAAEGEEAGAPAVLRRGRTERGILSDKSEAVGGPSLFRDERTGIREHRHLHETPNIRISYVEGGECEICIGAAAGMPLSDGIAVGKYVQRVLTEAAGDSRRIEFESIKIVVRGRDCKSPQFAHLYSFFPPGIVVKANKYVFDFTEGDVMQLFDLISTSNSASVGTIGNRSFERKDVKYVVTSGQYRQLKERIDLVRAAPERFGLKAGDVEPFDVFISDLKENMVVVAEEKTPIIFPEREAAVPSEVAAFAKRVVQRGDIWLNHTDQNTLFKCVTPTHLMAIDIGNPVTCAMLRAIHKESGGRIEQLSIAITHYHLDHVEQLMDAMREAQRLGIAVTLIVPEECRPFQHAGFVMANPGFADLCRVRILGDGEGVDVGGGHQIYPLVAIPELTHFIPCRGYVCPSQKFFYAGDVNLPFPPPKDPVIIRRYLIEQHANNFEELLRRGDIRAGDELRGFIDKGHFPEDQKFHVAAVAADDGLPPTIEDGVVAELRCRETIRLGAGEDSIFPEGVCIDDIRFKLCETHDKCPEGWGSGVISGY